MIALLNVILCGGFIALIALAVRGIYRKVKPEDATPAKDLGAKLK